MIHKIKIYEIRSHDFHTKVSLTGQLLSAPTLFTSNSHFNKAYLRRVTLHLQEVLKCMKTIEKEQAKKQSMTDTSSTAFARCSHTQEAKK